MRKNPFLRAEKAVIKKVYNNSATLKVTVFRKDYDNLTGALTETVYVFPRTIHISNPHEIADAIVDKIQYVKGDLNVAVAFKEITDVMVPMDGDPEIVIGGANKSISDFRNTDNRTAGLDETKDTIVFDGTTYRIVKITPKNIYAGMPSRLKLQLRAV